MNRFLGTLISVSNFSKAKNVSGQIATLLLVLITIVLILVMITANIGNVAVESTTIANAADAAALQLASNLATKAKMIYEGLGNRYEKCQKRGLLSVGLAALAAILVVAFCPVCVAALGAIGAGALAGAVGGALGAAMQGTSVLQGAIQGAAIGGAIGGAAGGIQNIANTGSLTGGEVLAGSGSVAAGEMGPALIIPATEAIGAVAYGSLGVASSVYYAGVQYQMPAKMAAQLEKDLNKLVEKDRFRESAFFTALKQVVDDPTMHADEDDIDLDNYTDDLIPRFTWWWHRRMLRFAEVRNQHQPLLVDFLASMKAFRDFAANTYLGDNVNAGMLERLDYRWSMETTGSDAGMEVAVPGWRDGNIVRFTRALSDAGYSTSCISGACWESGPAPAEINTWLDEDCGEGVPCSAAPASYDGIDALADDLRAMVSIMDGIAPPSFDTWFFAQTGGMTPASFPGSADLRADYESMAENASPEQSWDGWINFFYDIDNVVPGTDTGTYYYHLGTWIAYLQELRNALIVKRDNSVATGGLPECNEGQWDAVDPTICGACAGCVGCWNPCQIGAKTGCWVWSFFGWFCDFCCGACVHNMPCSFRNSPTVPTNTATINNNSDDELLPALNDIDSMIAEMTNFRNKIKTWAESMQAVTEEMMNGLGGLNPITYAWEDSRGNNQVIVEVSKFTIPYIRTVKHGNSLKGKICSVLTAANSDKVWVRVTKKNPSNKSLGPLGRWNPFIGGVTRVSRAYYGEDQNHHRDVKKVGIRSTSKN